MASRRGPWSRRISAAQSAGTTVYPNISEAAQDVETAADAMAGRIQQVEVDGEQVDGHVETLERGVKLFPQNLIRHEQSTKRRQEENMAQALDKLKSLVRPCRRRRIARDTLFHEDHSVGS